MLMTYELGLRAPVFFFLVLLRRLRVAFYFRGPAQPCETHTGDFKPPGWLDSFSDRVGVCRWRLVDTSWVVFFFFSCFLAPVGPRQITPLSFAPVGKAQVYIIKWSMVHFHLASGSWYYRDTWIAWSQCWCCHNDLHATQWKLLGMDSMALPWQTDQDFDIAGSTWSY